MKLVYDVFNAPSDLPPIIFLHGLLDWRYTWKSVAPEIARRTNRQVYTYDARNHGSSPRAAELDYDVLTQDLEEFLNDHSIDSAVIVGHSMGGRTAINFALKHPSRTEALIVVDMTPRNIDSGPRSLASQIARMIIEFLKSLPLGMDYKSGIKYFRDKLLEFVGEKFADVERLKKILSDQQVFPVVKIGDKFQAAADVDAVLSMLEKNALVQNLPDSGLEYTGDTLFLYGSKPFYNLEKDSSIKKLFPNATLKKIEGSTHYMHLDNPEVFVQEVSDFLLKPSLLQSKY